MSTKSIPDEARESLLQHYGLEHISKADDARETSDDEPEEMYTEEEILAMNTAQLTQSRSKRGLIPFIIGATAIALLVALIVGVSVVRSPGVALKGYSVTADAVSPIWRWSIFENVSSPIPYKISSIAGGIYIYFDPLHTLWLFGPVQLSTLDNAPVEITRPSGALAIGTIPGVSMLTNSTVAWVADKSSLPRSIFNVTVPGDICQPSAATMVENTIFVFWKYFHENAVDSYAWGTGILSAGSYDVIPTQSTQQDLLWDPEATIVVGNDIYVYFLHDSLYGDGKDELYVGKLPYSPTSFMDTAKYMTYWNGRNFGNSRSRAVPIIDQFGKQTSVVYNSYLQMYLLVDSGYGNTIKIYQSKSPYKDWNAAPASIFVDTVPVTQAYFMTSLFEDHGQTMYISYVQKGLEKAPRILKVKLWPSGH